MAIPYANHGMATGYHDVNGYAPIVLGRYYRLIHALAGVEPDAFRRSTLMPAVFDEPRDFLGLLLNVRYTINSRNELVEHASPRGFLPRFHLVDDTIVEPDPEKQLARLMVPGFDSARTAVLDRPLSTVSAAAAATDTGDTTVLSYEPEEIRLRTRSSRPRVLVASELAYPGWTASVDGQRVETAVANFAFRALAVPAGSHEVVLRYRPRSLVAGGILSVLAASAVLFLFVRA